jgi:hypothetical protein
MKLSQEFSIVPIASGQAPAYAYFEEERLG